MSQLLRKWFIWFFVKANSSAKCPACGLRAEHDLKFHPQLQQLIHGCKRCQAVWAESPLVAATLWHTVPAVQPEEKPKTSLVSIQR